MLQVCLTVDILSFNIRNIIFCGPQNDKIGSKAFIFAYFEYIAEFDIFPLDLLPLIIVRKTECNMVILNLIALLTHSVLHKILQHREGDHE